MAKVATRNVGGGQKKQKGDEPRFTVVRDGRVVYPSSVPATQPNGFTRDEADRLASGLALPATVVPIEDVDQLGRVKGSAGSDGGADASDSE